MTGRLLVPSKGRLACPPRFGTPRTHSRPTLGPAVGNVAKLLGQPFMPWQQHVADVAFEIDPATGRLIYSQVRLTVPRQSGKTTLDLAKNVHRGTATGFYGPRQQMVYTAQTRNKARKKWEEGFVATLQQARAFAGLWHPNYSNGNEHIRFANGSRLGIESNTEKAGHGDTLDSGDLDEAFAHLDNRLEQAFGPAMITRLNTQLWILSTAGWADGSPYLQDKVNTGRELVEAGVREGVCYFEWSASEDADPGDPATWWSCMPALGHTITEDAIRAEFLAWDLPDFQRAYCNMWVPRPRKDATTVIDMDVWEDRGEEDSQLDGRVGLGADCTPEYTFGAIGGGGERSDGLGHVELIEHRPGTGWMPKRLAELQRQHRTGSVKIDATGPMGALIPDLDKEKVDYDLMGAREYAQSCGSFYNDVVEDDGRIRHINQPALNTALMIAKKRPLGDAWAWARKNVNGDISPLVAVTLARHAYRVNAPKKKSPPLDVSAHGAARSPAAPRRRW